MDLGLEYSAGCHLRINLNHLSVSRKPSFSWLQHGHDHENQPTRAETPQCLGFLEDQPFNQQEIQKEIREMG